MEADGHGNLYAATENGLLKMNVRGTELFRAQNQKGRAVFNLGLDQSGSLWMANLAQQVLRFKNDSLYLVNSFEPQIDGSMPQINVEGSKPVILQRDLLYTIEHSGQIKGIDVPDPDVLRSNLVYHDSAWYFFQGESLFKYQNNEIAAVRAYGSHEDVKGGIQLFRHDGFFHILINSEDKIKVYRLEKTAGPVAAFTALENLVVTNVDATEDQISFCTSKGLLIYNLKADGSYQQQNILKNRTVTDVYRDRNNALVISTYKDGIYIMPNPKIEQIILPDRADYMITNLAKNKDGLYFIVNDSRLYHQQEDGSFRSSEIRRRSDQRLISDSEKETILINQGIYELENGDKTFRAAFPGIKDVLELDQHYYVATYNKLLKTDLDFNIIQTLAGRSSNIEALGLDRFVSDISGSLKVLNSELLMEDELKYDNLPVIPRKFQTAQSLGEIIILDENGKLLQAKKTGNQWIVDDLVIDGSNSIFKIRDFFIQDTDLYLLSDGGLIKKSLLDDKEERYDADGLINWKEATEIQADSENLHILTSSRILKISNEVFNVSIELPSYSAVYDLESVSEELRLPYDQRTLELEFLNDALLPQDQLKAQMNYKDAWVDFQINHQKIINGLSPGRHLISIRFQNLFTGAIATSMDIPVVIETPYYLEWWFLLFAVVLACTILWLIYFLRGRFVQRKMQKQLEQETKEKNFTQLKLENLRSQMNPHFVFNSLNSLQNYILSNDKTLASSYLVRFSRLMRLYLDHSRRSFISLKQEIAALKLYVELEKERYGDGFEYDFAFAKAIDLNNFLVPSLLLQPYVENAINHGLHHKKGDKNLIIRFEQPHEDQLLIFIVDDGVGRKYANSLNEENNHEPFSMMANKKRLDLMNTYYGEKLEITVSDRENPDGSPAGTQVKITLPKIKP